MSYVSFFSPPANPLGAVTIAVQDFETGTSTGVQDHTSATLGGLTPKAALIIASRHAVASEPSATADASLTLACITSGSSWYHAVFNDSGAGTTTVRRLWNGIAFLDVFDSSNTLGPFSHRGVASLTSGGVSLDYSEAALNGRFSYIAFAGDDLTVAAGSQTLGTGTGAISVSAGFEPDVVIFYGVCFNADNSLSTTAMAYSFGIATWDGSVVEQQCVAASEAGGLADSTPYQAMLSGRCGASVGSSLDYHVTASNFTSSGFSITPSASATSHRLSWLALNLGGRRSKLVAFDTPTTTGNFPITGAGFTPSFALAIVTNLEAVDPTFPLSSDDTMSGFAICAIGSDEQWSTGIRINANEATTETTSLLRNSAMIGSSGTVTAAFVASFVSWDSDGATFNASAVQGTGKKGFIWFVE